MHHSRRTGILLVVAVLIVSLAAPAAAKKGGNPGPPSGTGLEVTVEPSGSFMWANSAGDQILFDITVTNTSGGDLTGVTVDFNDEQLDVFDLAENGSWESQHYYTVVGSISLGGNTGDFKDAPISVQTQVPVGTVTAYNGTVSDSDEAVMMAYPVLPCVQDEEGGSFTFGPTADYSECSFIGSGDWQFTVTGTQSPRGKGGKGDSPSATVRDGIPGNWCTGTKDVNADGTVTYSKSLPDPTDGRCPEGGNGGVEIPVRNTTTFYLATRKGNTVDAGPVALP